MTLGNYKKIGWREWVGLPDLGIEAIKVKVDTGARTCALHATKIKYLRIGEERWVSFVVTTQLNPHHGVRTRARLIEKRRVKSSLGHSTLRPVIMTSLKLGEETWPVEVTLVNRDPMGFRMLLGRQALKGRFLVHPARSFLQSEERVEP
ncbi:MAG: RimK/LysX family protein [Bdellovibrionales bacterium]|nr:RimK/LysX family protein [Bdellovibrionales bacterium]